MRSTQSFDTGERPASSWQAVHRQVVAYLSTPCKLSDMQDDGPVLERQAGGAAAHWLLLAVFRHWLAVEAALATVCRQPPRPAVRAVLLIAGAELLASDEPARLPRIIHHAVEQAKRYSAAEARLVNAVLRRLPQALDTLQDVGMAHGHPPWLVRRWESQFGVESTLRLLAANQRPSLLWLELAPGVAVPSWLQVVAGAPAGYYGWRAAHRAQVAELVAGGQASVHDPMTRAAVDLLDPRPAERIVDLCAAPGGKTWQIAMRMTGRGWLRAVDLAGPRFERLALNCAAWAWPGFACVAGDVLELATDAGDGRLRRSLLADGPIDGLLIDVPCSNTGVLGRRPDVRLRLSAAEITRQASVQLALLRAAGGLVRPGGRLVYATCSLEPEENEAVIRTFLADNPQFSLAGERHTLPWATGGDGGGAFRLERAVGG
jgi:16S rRNA (cytosine967-C5)-methyltransferase